MGLGGKHVLVCVGGGIAAFKAVELVRELSRRGAAVRVAMTESAGHFVGAATFAGVTGETVLQNLWDHPGEAHVALSAWADVTVVAPATANLLARAAAGMADDAVLATLACASGPVFFAPAMHERMWQSAATRRNVEQLRADGATLVGPVTGALASGDSGEGRMAEPMAIVEALEAALGGAGDLAGCRLLVTAGPTLEDLDPVRFLGNRSTGRMGYAIAEGAAARGAEVTLVAGPTALPPPRGATVFSVRNAREMHAEVTDRAGSVDAIVMAAAVADYRPAERAEHKLKKADGPMQLSLVRNPDILADLGQARTGQRPLLVGFAVESERLLERARAKLAQKGCDLIVANPAGVAFGTDQNRAALIEADGHEELGDITKAALAERILDWIRTRLA